MDRITGPAELVSRLEAIKQTLADPHGDNVFNAQKDLSDLIEHLKEPGKGVNPVTVPGVNPQTGYKKNVSLARIWLDRPATAVDDGQQRAGVGAPPVEERQKDVTFIVWDGPPEKPNILQVVKINERDFTEALAQIFPLRELWVESGASKVNTELLIRMLRGQQ